MRDIDKLAALMGKRAIKVVEQLQEISSIAIIFPTATRKVVADLRQAVETETEPHPQVAATRALLLAVATYLEAAANYTDATNNSEPD